MLVKNPDPDPKLEFVLNNYVKAWSIISDIKMIKYNTNHGEKKTIRYISIIRDVRIDIYK